jgi:hypothetical protein
MLLLHPAGELVFELLPDTSTINAVLRIKNAIGEKVAFKVQTTVPEAYLVRPNVGLLGVGEVSEVVITLKTGKLHPTQRHKFSISAVKTDLEGLESLSSLWTTVSKVDLQTAVLRVVFQQPNQHEARSSIPPLSGFPLANKPSPVLAKELLNANLQYTELVKYYVKRT